MKPSGGIKTGYDSVRATGTQGIDVSRYQGGIDWAQVSAAGTRFVAIKATEGACDYAYCSHFETNAGQARNNGLAVGGYHFFSPSSDGKEQADYFLRIAQPAAGDLLPMLDLEQSGDASAAQIAAGAMGWLQTVEGAIGRRPFLYTTASFWNEIGAPKGFEAYPLWIADYGVATPALPDGWADYTVWQYSQQGKLAGVSGPVDLDILKRPLRSVLL
ncbi:glycoside hydrolase family 25 protein [Hoeflea prorocentri]|uniref:Glycoside hydrolase family 25 protein n=1 Tax=Hoeflea prorocentri TaxID=1922333 RepID=A0A9X3UEV8_9HYPH|nr:glycoside hydrolase family 25 protein [Hoeflea prorocentri]MCY6379446.1 glycoside hydrolase family 25 protein [Hoeflea prorocentri]MDA5397247.1 glycoside hydrolase family 25 protein [Hoeflea prorocentri]